MTNYNANNIDFANATRAELEAAGFSIDVRRSQATRRQTRSVWGAKPSANKKGCGKASVGSMTQDGRGTIG